MPRKDKDFPNSPPAAPEVLTLPRGAAAQIARSLRPPVTVQHVCEVAKGRKSARVRRAIERYLSRRAAQAA